MFSLSSLFVRKSPGAYRPRQGIVQHLYAEERPIKEAERMEQWKRVALDEALRTAGSMGYTEQFIVTKEGLLLPAANRYFQADEFHIDDFVLLEKTAASQIAVLYITTSNGDKGVLVI